MIPNLKIDYVVINAGVLRYPNVRSNGLACFDRAALTYPEGHRAVRLHVAETFLIPARLCVVVVLQLSSAPIVRIMC